MDRVPIGEPLLNTRFHVSFGGELLIGGSRQCYVDGERSGDWTQTGDLVELMDDGSYYWVGRTDEQVTANILLNCYQFGITKQFHEHLKTEISGEAIFTGISMFQIRNMEMFCIFIVC